MIWSKVKVLLLGGMATVMEGATVSTKIFDVSILGKAVFELIVPERVLNVAVPPLRSNVDPTLMPSESFCAASMVYSNIKVLEPFPLIKFA